MVLYANHHTLVHLIPMDICAKCFRMTNFSLFYQCHADLIDTLNFQSHELIHSITVVV
jgi:hypothetical protein